MDNIFSKAKSKKSKGKEVITINDSELYDKLKELRELQDTIERSKTKSEVISLKLKEKATQEWIALYDKNKENPGTLHVNVVDDFTGDEGSFMFVPSDKYTTIDEYRADTLRDNYGDAIVDEKTEFSFNKDLIAKYGETISRLILESDEIEEDDKGKIIEAKTTYSISKGTIDKLNEYGNVNEVYRDVRVVVSLKDVTIL